jgi:hypothetical protein
VYGDIIVFSYNSVVILEPKLISSVLTLCFVQSVSEDNFGIDTFTKSAEENGKYFRESRLDQMDEACSPRGRGKTFVQSDS